VLLHHHFNLYKSKTYASNDLRFCLIFIYLNPHSQKEKKEILVGFYNLVLNQVGTTKDARGATNKKTLAGNPPGFSKAGSANLRTQKR
jgi:hypothetical protein